MRHRLLLFNCSTDMALASGLDHYTPPPLIQCMERELELLPLWWAEEGDVVLVTDIERAKCFLDEVNQQLERSQQPRLNVFFADVNGRLSDRAVRWEDLVPMPWGWNKSVARRLLRLGLCPETIPDDGWLERMRQLSNRRLAVVYLRDLLRVFSLDGSCAESLAGQEIFFAENQDELVSSVRRLLVDGPVIMKSPWSSSGKGNAVVRDFDENTMRWATSVCTRQGGMCLNRFYHKRMDFAMEFRMGSDGACSFLGYSLFRADAVGRYEGNVVASQDDITHAIVAGGANQTLLESLAEYHRQYLPLYLGAGYEGVVGIDMLLAEVGGQVCVHPCIEINLRMNMGVVALRLYDRSCQNRYLTPPDNPHFRAKVDAGMFFIERPSRP